MTHKKKQPEYTIPQIAVMLKTNSVFVRHLVKHYGIRANQSGMMGLPALVTIGKLKRALRKPTVNARPMPHLTRIYTGPLAKPRNP